MASTTGTGEGETVGLPVVGQEGDTCERCGSALATDQRYCLNCGWRRGEARVDYERRLGAAPVQPMANGSVPAARPANPQWSPVMAIGAIALLGIFLLLGVLIGKNDNNTTQTVEAQAPATTTTTAATPTTDTTAAAPAKSKGGNKAAAAGTAPGAGNVVQGGSGNTEGIATADTNKSVQENAKSGPDVVATGGAPEKLDPNGQAGGGSGATCIGC
jgi:cytoskeletal protein RodZ